METHNFCFVFNFIQFSSSEAIPPYLTWATVLTWSTCAEVVNARMLLLKHFRKTQRPIVGRWI